MSRLGCGSLHLVTALLVTFFLTNLPARATPNTFSTTGSLSVTRSNHTATLLPDGRVLVTGGMSNHEVLASAEIYDPATRAWSTVAPMKTARQYHSATLLPNGKVLLVGGADVFFNDFNTAEIYDPVTNAWSDTGSFVTPRDSHTATLLANGKVLIVGGYGPLASTELYDPASGTWSAGGTLHTARYNHTVTLLSSDNGNRLLVTGGADIINPLASAEIYNPDNNSWNDAAPLNTALQYHTATLLPDGRVLVTGGQTTLASYLIPLASAQIYNPSSDQWINIGNMHTARYAHTATLLYNGKVLVAGGSGNSGALDSAELYNPANSSWIQTTGSLAIARYSHTATVLPDNKVLAVGGVLRNPLASAELFDPGAFTDLENWRIDNFGSSANSGDGADLNDYNKDGIVNLLEYAFGLNSKQNNAGRIPRGQVSGDKYTISFTQADTVTGITYGAEWSETMLPGSWQAVTDTGTPPQHTFSVPVAPHPKLFLRLKVSSP